MVEIKIPETELKKLEQLIGLKIFSSEETDVYKIIVDMASAILECPFVGITLMDPARQWVKSPVGFTYSEAPNTGPFYDEILAHPQDVMIVKNTLLDPRFNKERNVTGGLNIRFLLGMAISPEKPIGVLSVADDVPREAPSSNQIESLKYLVKFTALTVRLRSFVVDLYEEIQELKQFRIPDGYEMETTELFGKLDKALDKVKARRRYFK